MEQRSGRRTLSRVRTGKLHCYLFLFLAVFSFASCQKEAGSAVPEAIIALTKEPNCTCESYIDLYTWRNDPTYIKSCKGPTCFCGIAYYDEKGAPLDTPPDYTFTDFLDEARYERNIWTCAQ